MSAVHTPAGEFLQLGRVRDLLRAPGPCMTVILPAFHPGDAAGSASVALRSHLQAAERSLEELSLSKAGIAELLEPVYSLAGEASGSHWGQAIFRCPSAMRHVFLVHAAKEGTNIGGCFALRHLLNEMSLPPVFYVLTLSTKRVKLLRCENFKAETVALPGGLPETESEALAFEPRDHTLENRSAAGSALGSMRRVRFGTGSMDKQIEAHRSEFYKLADGAVQTAIGTSGAPLILAGVEEDTALYRTTSTAPTLITKTIPGSPGPERAEIELLNQAHRILKDHFVEQQAIAVRAARERYGPGRFLTDPGAILRASFDGRVERLYLNENASITDVFERDPYQSWGAEDLLNLAAVQTLIHQGTACELPASSIPEKAPAAAVLRY